MIITVVKPFGSMLKFKDVDIYNTVFKMHTKLTFLILIIFFIFVSSREFFGAPIHCVVADNEIKSYAENYCWINGIFTLENGTKFVNGKQIIQPVREYRKYYQWMVIVLLIQAILCYIPASLWKNWEHGRMKALCGSLGSPIVAVDYQNQKKRIVDYLKLENCRIHSVYVLRYVICEVMNFLIVVVNMWFLDAIFNHFWTRYLPAVLALLYSDGELFSHLASDIFPKLVKCTYSYVGSSGSEQYLDARCLLSLNIVNEKIFAFLYVWYVMLLFISSCNLIYRSILLISSKLRMKLLHSLTMTSTGTTKIHIETILRDKKIGDWFLLYQLGRNLNPNVFREILDEVADMKLIQ